MRKSGKWMTIWDDRILEYIITNESASVGELANSGYVRVSNTHVSRRCKKLAEHGMLKPLGNGVYIITERGEAYLDGELDTSEESQDDSPSISSEINGDGVESQEEG
ncbi:MarR family transcriptional regulator [Haladaptatus sp. CMAA 1911]|uniref:MarR family transcriptional regulator n=1 Tax=unclassified Haladaptatus TaxID=2622732 RepID=UPI003754433D